MSTENPVFENLAAEEYESRYIPNIFEEWAGYLLEETPLQIDAKALDVGCGTGIVARKARKKVGDKGFVTGIDIDSGMLSVAHRMCPGVDFMQSDATALPFPDKTYDVVFCQAALMFFPDPEKAIQEMARVVKDGGVVSLVVWDQRSSQPAYGPFFEAIAQIASAEASNSISAYLDIGDTGRITTILEAANLQIDTFRTRLGVAEFSSLREVIDVEVGGTPVAEILKNQDTYILRKTIEPYVLTDGRVEMPFQGHIIIARKISRTSI
ncbi:class I SAM-dependent methyltransferase [Streptomyces sp. NPDC055109]